jgi:hypothetical protein
MRCALKVAPDRRDIRLGKRILSWATIFYRHFQGGFYLTTNPGVEPPGSVLLPLRGRDRTLERSRWNYESGAHMCLLERSSYLNSTFQLKTGDTPYRSRKRMHF